MSMIWAPGAMEEMTALQMATESLAVPKSVRKTMKGRGAGEEAESDFCAGWREQAQAKKTARNKKSEKKRPRRFMVIEFPQESSRALSKTRRMQRTDSGRHAGRRGRQSVPPAFPL